MYYQGVRKLTGVDLKVVWAEFSTISMSVTTQFVYVMHTATSRVENSAL